MRFGVPGISWVNYAFVWAFVHQLGYAWATRDRRDRCITTGFGVTLAGGSLAALAGLTTIGWYPVAMVTIPGGGSNNITPPNVAVGILALIQIGIILATKDMIKRLALRPKVWRSIIAVSGLMMPTYLWHLTSLSLMTALGMFTLNGVAFSLEPGTTLWWATCPVFDIVLATATLVLIALFGRFEIDVNSTYRNMSRLVVTVGLVLTIVVLSATAFIGLVTRAAGENWWIPILAIIAAASIGVYHPRGWSRSTPERRTSDQLAR